MSNRSNRAQMYEDLSADFGASLGNPKSVAQKNQKGPSGPHLQPGFHIRSGVRASRRSAYHTANADMILLQPTTPFTIAQPANELTGQHSTLASPIQFNDIQHDHDPYTGYFPASSIRNTQSYRPHVLEHDMSIALNDSEPSFSTFPFDGYYAAPLEPMIGGQQSPPNQQGDHTIDDAVDNDFNFDGFDFGEPNPDIDTSQEDLDRILAMPIHKPLASIHAPLGIIYGGSATVQGSAEEDAALPQELQNQTGTQNEPSQSVPQSDTDPAATPTDAQHVPEQQAGGLTNVAGASNITANLVNANANANNATNAAAPTLPLWQGDTPLQPSSQVNNVTLNFATKQDYLAYKGSRLQARPSDSSLPTTWAAKGVHVLRLKRAIIDNSKAEDKKSGSWKKRWSGAPGKLFYDENGIEHICWELVDKSIKLHRFGPGVLNCYDPNHSKKYRKGLGLTFQQRINAIVEYLLKSKARVDTLMKHDTLDTLVAIPHLLIPSSKANRDFNNSRGEDIKIGRQIRQIHEETSSEDQNAVAVDQGGTSSGIDIVADGRNDAEFSPDPSRASRASQSPQNAGQFSSHSGTVAALDHQATDLFEQNHAGSAPPTRQPQVGPATSSSKPSSSTTRSRKGKERSDPLPRLQPDSSATEATSARTLNGNGKRAAETASDPTSPTKHARNRTWKGAEEEPEYAKPSSSKMRAPNSQLNANDRPIAQPHSRLSSGSTSSQVHPRQHSVALALNRSSYAAQTSADPTAIGSSSSAKAPSTSPNRKRSATTEFDAPPVPKRR